MRARRLLVPHASASGSYACLRPCPCPCPCGIGAAVVKVVRQWWWWWWCGMARTDTRERHVTPERGGEPSPDGTPALTSHEGARAAHHPLARQRMLRLHARAHQLDRRDHGRRQHPCATASDERRHVARSFRMCAQCVSERLIRSEVQHRAGNAHDKRGLQARPQRQNALRRTTESACHDASADGDGRTGRGGRRADARGCDMVRKLSREDDGSIAHGPTSCRATRSATAADDARCRELQQGHSAENAPVGLCMRTLTTSRGVTNADVSSAPEHADSACSVRVRVCSDDAAMTVPVPFRRPDTESNKDTSEDREYRGETVHVVMYMYM